MNHVFVAFSIVIDVLVNLLCRKRVMFSYNCIAWYHWVHTKRCHQQLCYGKYM